MVALIERLLIFLGLLRPKKFKTDHRPNPGEVRPPRLAEPSHVLPGLPQPPKRPTARTTSPAPSPSDIEASGRWYHLRDLLDVLDQHFFYIRRMKGTDREGYDFYSRVGGYVISPKAEGWTMGGILPSSWRQRQRPSFGLVSMTREADPEKVHARFIYFYRITQSDFMEKCPESDVYRVTVYYDSGRGKKLRFPAEYAVAVSWKDASVRLVKERFLASRRLPITKRKSSSGSACLPNHTAPTRTKSRLGGERVTMWRFGYPQNLRSLFAAHKEEGTILRKQTIEEYATAIFIWVAGIVDNAGADTHVRVSKGNLDALFCIPIERTPYFFKDRQLVVNHNGRRKKIFHIVRAHTRKSGKLIKTHFRGMRKFEWNGYRITISMPGFHHINQMLAPLEALEFAEDPNDPKKYLDMEQAGKRIQESLRA